MDHETLHVVTSVLTVLLTPLFGAFRNSRLNPELKARLAWLTASVKGLAKRAGHKLEPEPLDLDEVTGPGRGRLR